MEDRGSRGSDAIITIVIVTFRSKQELPACLKSIGASSVPARVVIVDNDSGDGTYEFAKDLASGYRDVQVLSSARNVGLAAANNLALPYLVGSYVLILNPDTILESDTLARMLHVLESEPGVAVVGPKCFYEDGTPHTSYHLGWGYGHLVLWRMLPYSMIRRAYDRYAKYVERDVFFVSGACLMIRRDVLEQIGGYDALFFLTVEDAADLCLRAGKEGGRVRYLPSARIYHLCGRSGVQVPFVATLEGYKGSIYYFRKHRGRIGGLLAYAVVFVSCLIKTAISFLKVVFARREVDKSNLQVYLRILPVLWREGPSVYLAREI